MHIARFLSYWMILKMKSIIFKGSQLYIQEEIKWTNSLEPIALLWPHRTEFHIILGDAVKWKVEKQPENV